jgi:hypothetical protein
VDLNLIVPFYAMARSVASFGPSWTANKLLSGLNRFPAFSVTIRSTVPVVNNKVLVERDAPPSGAALIISIRRVAAAKTK